MSVEFQMTIMMMKRQHQTYPTSIMYLIFMLLMFLCSKRTNSLHDNSDNQLQLLLSFKYSIKDPLNYLSDWSSSAINFCKWHGIICNNSSSILSIELSGKNFSGKVSESIFQLQSIETIDLSNNQLTGQISLEMFSAGSSIRHLNLSNNNFTGPLLRGSVSSLQVLDLSNNMFSGKIPQDIGSFSSLKYLDLGGNAFVGKIPVSISNISTLESFTLASNQLVGQIPNQLGQMKNLKWIYLGYNNLTGEIPKEIGELNFLNHLDLVYNNLTGTIPESIGNLTELKYLFLYQNKLKGPIPKSLFGLKKLISLDFSDNSLSGEISELVINLQELEILHLFSNNFTGNIPSALASLPKLQVLQLWSNELSGKIPKDLGKRNNFTIIDLSTNSLTGNIPDTLCESGRLFKLILFSNSLEGVFPKSLSYCHSLVRVRLQNNRLSGELFPELTKLPLVYFFDISGNNISGRVDDRNWDMPSLQMLNFAGNNFFGYLPDSFGGGKLKKLDLSDNSFSGVIPQSFGNFSELMQLKLSRNRLSGQIPKALSSCQKLVSIDLSHNQLTGEIPKSLAEMPILEELDLSENQLTGEIPMDLGSSVSLVEVNISHNHFHGNLPSTGAFLAINASSVIGNHLCSDDSKTELRPCNRKNFKHQSSLWFIIVVCSVFALLVGFSALLVFFTSLLLHRKRGLELKKIENENGVWELKFFDIKASKLITIEDILSSTKEGNVVSIGTEGFSYRGKSAIKGFRFLVKEVNDVSSSAQSFWSEVEEFGNKLKHPNIVKLIAICRSQNVAYFVYEYFEGKSLSEVLRNLSWESRRKIALQVARALRFSHCYHFPCFVVGHISPENVIVDGKDEVRLCLSLPGLMSTDSKSFTSSAYVAPEANKGSITENSNIYGFGLILIELLTGKGPADTEFGVDDNSFVEWARYSYSECYLDTWVDDSMKGNVSSNQNQIIETMNLALHCTASDPMARPSANDLLKTLESMNKPSYYYCLSSFRVSSQF